MASSADNPRDPAHAERITSGELPILVTAFEPSGDEHASGLIAVLKRRYPGIRICGWGGPKMAEAGAEIIERTGDDAVMGLPGLKKIREHKQVNARIAAWVAKQPIALHVPVDSPAANFPICKITRKAGVPVVHLVAPQLWAWGSFRVRKLRRLTDHVLCLLPFEEAWFAQRDVPATFIGHPLFDRPIDQAAIRARAADYPSGSPKLALLPGSRPGEILKNFPLLLESFSQLKKQHADAAGLIAATTEPVAARLEAMANDAGGMPEGLGIVVGQTDAVVNWCDLALVVSGTVTLQIARQAKPMVIVYKSSPVMYALLGSWLIDTELFALPNLIAGKEVVPELIPHFGDSGPIVEAARRLLDNPEQAEQQSQALRDVVARFDGSSASPAAADAIERILGLDASVDPEAR